MQSIKITVLCLLLTANFNSRQQSVIIPKDAVKGDFDGDGKPEYVWVVKPNKINEDGFNCDGKCYTNIASSNPAILPLSIEDAIGGTITNLGDLNNDGKDEIGILPDWFIGCWRHYYVYTLKGKNWQEAVPSFPTYCSQWEDGVKNIKQIPGKKGYVTIRYSVYERDSIITKLKIVPIK